MNQATHATSTKSKEMPITPSVHTIIQGVVFGRSLQCVCYVAGLGAGGVVSCLWGMRQCQQGGWH
eukprot:2777738-Ditylum_brightwellii.AAC.1